MLNLTATARAQTQTHRNTQELIYPQFIFTLGEFLLFSPCTHSAHEESVFFMPPSTL